MARWRSYDEIRQQIRQELAFAAAGIGDLLNVDALDDGDDAPRCPEGGEIWPCSFEASG
jgi:hypothetical protein